MCSAGQTIRGRRSAAAGRVSKRDPLRAIRRLRGYGRTLGPEASRVARSDLPAHVRVARRRPGARDVRGVLPEVAGASRDRQAPSAVVVVRAAIAYTADILRQRLERRLHGDVGVVLAALVRVALRARRVVVAQLRDDLRALADGECAWLTLTTQRRRRGDRSECGDRRRRRGAMGGAARAPQTALWRHISSKVHHSIVCSIEKPGRCG